MLGYEDKSLIFKALSDPTRLKVLEMISHQELCACDLLEAFEITQPTLSYHMKILTLSGLVDSRKDGLWMRYSLKKEPINDLKVFLDHLNDNLEKQVHN